MLEGYEEEIPAIDELRPKVQRILADPTKHLKNVQDEILEHILEKTDVDPTGGDAYGAVWDVSVSAVEDIIPDLDVSEINFRRLQLWISVWDSYDAYDRLVTAFGRFLSKPECKKLVKKGKRIFVKCLTDHWKLA